MSKYRAGLISDIESVLRNHYKVVRMIALGSRKHTVIGLCCKQEFYLHPLSSGRIEFEKELKEMKYELAEVAMKHSDSWRMNLLNLFKRRSKMKRTMFVFALVLLYRLIAVGQPAPAPEIPAQQQIQIGTYGSYSVTTNKFKTATGKTIEDAEVNDAIKALIVEIQNRNTVIQEQAKNIDDTIKRTVKNKKIRGIVAIILGLLVSAGFGAAAGITYIREKKQEGW